MTGNYYYFVSGLPEMFLDDGKKGISCIEFTGEAREQLDEADFSAFTTLLYPVDNANLLALIDKKDTPFDRRGNFSEEVLASGLKNADDLPPYMQQFLDTLRENRSIAAGLTHADMLAWYFFDEMAAHPLPFISEWYSFDRTLRNLAAAINSRSNIAHIDALATEREKSLSSIIIGHDDAAESILRSNAPDFGLSSLFPDVEQVLSFAKGALPDFEKGLDTLRWNTLNSMTESLYFNAETIFAFYIKLTIVERWQALDPKTGKAHLDRLIRELKGSYALPSTF